MKKNDKLSVVISQNIMRLFYTTTAMTCVNEPTYQLALSTDAIYHIV